MPWFKVLFLALALSFTACAPKIAPTPVLIKSLVSQNNEVQILYVACSDGANYAPEQPNCVPELLAEKVDTTMATAKEFIRADIKQPHGYDIYLATAMIYFRIGERNSQQYSNAELLARQFFEVQKAHSSRSVNTARFYWVAMATAHASWQWHNDPLALDGDRKSELMQCYAEGNTAFPKIDAGPRKVRLLQYLEVLKAIIAAIPDN